MKFLQLAEKHNLPKMVSIQNPYNLLNRAFEVGLSEVAHHEGVQLLAYSPLAFGCLSGKYLNGARPEGARCSIWQRFGRYFTPQGEQATQAYVDLAHRFEIEPAQMALAFVNQRPFVAANIIGATTLDQLKENIDSLEVNLDDELLNEIDKIGQLYSNPCP
jgi:aryl-alcohol dehydrogenase-like predicted oxidoreductase